MCFEANKVNIMKAVTITQIDATELEKIIDSTVKKAISSHSAGVAADKSKKNQWLNLSEICEYHPNNPSPQTVYGWVSEQKIPYYKGHDRNVGDGALVKGGLRFFRPEIDEWLKQGRQKTAKEIEEAAEKFLDNKKKKGKR